MPSFIALALVTSALAAVQAQAAPALQATAVSPWQARSVGEALLAATAFGLVGLVLILIGFKAFDWITPKIDVQRELTENKNIAVAIVVAALIIAVAIVISKAIAG